MSHAKPKRRTLGFATHTTDMLWCVCLSSLTPREHYTSQWVCLWTVNTTLAKEDQQERPLLYESLVSESGHFPFGTVNNFVLTIVYWQHMNTLSHTLSLSHIHTLSHRYTLTYTHSLSHTYIDKADRVGYMLAKGLALTYTHSLSHTHLHTCDTCQKQSLKSYFKLVTSLI